MKRRQIYAHSEREQHVWDDYRGMTENPELPTHYCRECEYYVPGIEEYNCRGFHRLTTIGPLKAACERFKQKEDYGTTKRK